MKNNGLLATIELSIMGSDEPIFRAPNARAPIDHIEKIETDQYLFGRAGHKYHKKSRVHSRFDFYSKDTP